MKILSDFYDYYDGLQSYDDDLIYRRFPTSRAHQQGIYGDFVGVKVADKLFVGIWKRSEIFWDYDEYLGQFKGLRSDAENSPWSFHHKNRFLFHSKIVVEKQSQIMKAILDYDEPIEMVDSHNHYKNLKLPKSFASVLPPFKMFQTLERYVANQVAPDKTPEMPNDIKIELAGFDLKKSFRHRK